MENLIIRNVTPSDFENCVEIENQSFSEAEAASRESIAKRIHEYPGGYLVAEKDGRLVGMINSGSTNKDDITDENFKKLIGHDPDGKNIVVFSLSVLPRFRKNGVAAELMNRFIEESKKMGKDRILLLCKEQLVHYYEKFGFRNNGLSASTHGGGAWHEMSLHLLN